MWCSDNFTNDIFVNMTICKPSLLQPTICQNDNFPKRQFSKRHFVNRHRTVLTILRFNKGTRSNHSRLSSCSRVHSNGYSGGSIPLVPGNIDSNGTGLTGSPLQIFYGRICFLFFIKSRFWSKQCVIGIPSQSSLYLRDSSHQ